MPERQQPSACDCDHGRDQADRLTKRFYRATHEVSPEQTEAQAKAEAGGVSQHVGPLAHAQHGEKAQAGRDAQKKGALETTHRARGVAPHELQTAQ